MPRPTEFVPKLRRQPRPDGADRAFVVFDGERVYVGPWGSKEAASKEAQDERDRLVAVWLANGRKLPGRKTPEPIAGGRLVADLVAAYWDWATAYYRKHGEPTTQLSVIRVATRALLAAHAELPAAAFAPKHLAAVRDRLVEAGHTRGDVNRAIISGIFKWATVPERADDWRLPEHQYHALLSVERIRIGRSRAPDPKPVGAATEAQIAAVRPFVGAVVADMMDLQRLAGTRPSEICIVRPCDIDRADPDGWVYTPTRHKTEHHNRLRKIVFGPKAQAIISPYLENRAPDAFLFSPREAELARLATRRAARKTKVQPSQQNRRKAKPRIRAGDRYTDDSFRQAVVRGWQQAAMAHLKSGRPDLLAKVVAARSAQLQACKALANAKGTATPEQLAELRKARKVATAAARASLVKAAADAGFVPCWHPNQLRHAAATKVDRHAGAGADGARAVLGHSSAKTTERYIERDIADAKKIMREIG